MKFLVVTVYMDMGFVSIFICRGEKLCGVANFCAGYEKIFGSTRVCRWIEMQ